MINAKTKMQARRFWSLDFPREKMKKRGESRLFFAMQYNYIPKLWNCK